MTELPCFSPSLSFPPSNGTPVFLYGVLTHSQPCTAWATSGQTDQRTGQSLRNRKGSTQAKKQSGNQRTDRHSLTQPPKSYTTKQTQPLATSRSKTLLHHSCLSCFFVRAPACSLFSRRWMPMLAQEASRYVVFRTTFSRLVTSVRPSNTVSPYFCFVLCF